MERKRLQDVLPKLAQMMAKDFSDFSDEWEDVLRAYAEVFKWLNEEEGSRVMNGFPLMAVMIQRDKENCNSFLHLP